MNIYLFTAFLAPLIISDLAFIRTEAGFAMLLLTYLLSWKQIRHFNKNQKLLHLELIAFAAIICLYVFLGVSKTRLGGMNLLIVLWAMVSVSGLFLYRKFNPEQRDKLFVVINFLCFASVLLELKNGRQFLSAPGHGDAYGAAYISTFLFLYTCINYMLFLNLRENRLKWFSLSASLLAFFVLVFIFERGISTVLCALCLMLVFMVSKKPTQAFFIACFFILGLIAVFVFPEYVIGFINNNLGERLAKRLSAVIIAFSSDSESAVYGSFQARLILIGRSLHTWTHNFGNFFLGIGEHTEKNFYLMGLMCNSKISNHSHILDILPKYGVFAGLLVCDILRRLYIEISSHIENKKLRAQAAVIYIGMVIRGIIGAIFVPQVAVVISLLLPLAAEYCERRNRQETESE